MLVLSRRIGETIVIGGNVRVLVLGKNHNRVKIGIVRPFPSTCDVKNWLATGRTERVTVPAGRRRSNRDLDNGVLNDPRS